MWIYNDKEFNTEDIKDYKGFVYLITDLTTDMKYIGQKRFWRKITRPPLKGKKRKRVEYVESDWRKYYGSNDALNLLVESTTPDRFQREILHLCEGHGEMNYLEMYEQVTRHALLRDDYYNGIIQVRISSRHVGNLKKQFDKR